MSYMEACTEIPELPLEERVIYPPQTSHQLPLSYFHSVSPIDAGTDILNELRTLSHRAVKPARILQS